MSVCDICEYKEIMRCEYCEKDVKKREQVELINDILDAREARKPKEVITKTILSCSEFDSLKKRIRKEIAEECRPYISDEIYVGQSYPVGKTPGHKEDVKKEAKKPLHPGKVANDILVIKGYQGIPYKVCLVKCGHLLAMNGVFLCELFEGRVGICHTVAYKLAKVIEGTDVRFWMDLQERYDSYAGEDK